MAGEAFEREIKIAPVGHRVKCRATAEGADIEGWLQNRD